MMKMMQRYRRNVAGETEEVNNGTKRFKGVKKNKKRETRMC